MGAQSEGQRAEMALEGGLLASWALLGLRTFVFLILSFFFIFNFFIASYYLYNNPARCGLVLLVRIKDSERLPFA